MDWTGCSSLTYGGGRDWFEGQLGCCGFYIWTGSWAGGVGTGTVAVDWDGWIVVCCTGTSRL